jgi:hypothetical protein
MKQITLSQHNKMVARIRNEIDRTKNAEQIFAMEQILTRLFEYPCYYDHNTLKINVDQHALEAAELLISAC